MQKNGQTERITITRDEYVLLMEKFNNREVIDGMMRESVSVEVMPDNCFNATIEWVRIDTERLSSSAVPT